MQTIFQRTPMAAVLAGLALVALSAGAHAADCPADKVGTDVTKPGPTTPSGLTDTLISSIDLSAMGPGLAGHKLRMRKLVIQPGGIVP